MSDIQSRQPDDEIDLSELVKTLWQGKWTIVACTCLCFVVGAAYHKFSANPFTATLEIKPITQVDENQYQSFNEFNNAADVADVADIKMLKPKLAPAFSKITASTLLLTYSEALNNKDFWYQRFEEALSAKRGKFDDIDDFDKFIKNEVYSVSIKTIKASETLKNIPVSEDYIVELQLTYKGSDLEKFSSVLTGIAQDSANYVKLSLVQNFENQAIVRQQSDKFKKQDLQNAIANLLADYDKNTMVKLAFLDEQGKIARKLGIAKSTFESQTFQSNASSVTNVNTDTPFYMRGFEAIEEEASLLKSRNNKSVFMPELIDLEAQVRAIEQDKTVLRAQALFEFTPLKSSTASFVAAQVDINEADIQYSRKGSLILALSLVLGGFIGIFAVFVRKAIISK
jgi:LPS O-antigen subunit length determinant protein (WzzB/FepE family)